MRLIDLHKEWCETKEIDGFGLCGSVPRGYVGLLKMFKPTKEWKKILEQDNIDSVFWGYEFPRDRDSFFGRYSEYTPLRQTIVLLICAMKGELK